MQKSALLVTTCLLTACTGGPGTPAPSVAYVPATPVMPEQPSAPRPVASVTRENPIPAPKQVKYRSHEAATAAARRAATQTALDGTFEGAILNYEYQHGRVYRVVVDAPSAEWETDADVTTLTLGPDEEEIPDIAQGGDSNWFLVEHMGSGTDETSMRARKA